MTAKKLSQLDNSDLLRHPAWLAVGDYAQDVDAELVPLPLDEGRIPETAGEVWCFCTVTFADGTEHLGSAMCRGDSKDTLSLWSVWKDEEPVRILVPPAPSFVLEKQGPSPFARHFGRCVGEVFPLTIQAVPPFAVNPQVRAVRLDLTGVEDISSERNS